VSDHVAQFFSTAEAPPGRALSHWREMVDAAFVPLDVTPLGAAGEFRAAVRLHQVGELRVAHLRASPMAALRNHRHVARSREDEYFLALQLRGRTEGRQDGRQVTLRAGELALFDSTRPYALEFRGGDSFEHVIYRIPRAALDARGDALGRATGIRVAAQCAEGKLASRYLVTLARSAPPLRDGAAYGLSASALDLLALALDSAAGARVARGARPALARIKQQARARLGDPELCPAGVAAASYVSVRQLHRLFAAEGVTFGGFVREARLSRCREDLADPRLAEHPIAEVAARNGYRSAAHFTRTFSARYGITPREFRAQAQQR
jgi:AraC-like DNA-binding protein